ncbi:MAG: hypothetical protein JXR48_03880 [Candidatus Delongbacteria bacterium]|nr:hypothetical protein [Candidatus Delongbacteria bacterium]MBN2834086.1 hypothetical protein [Candidatus Delongbacteria bacterium]
MEEEKYKKYVVYYRKFKELVKLHREFEFGLNPQLPSVFSEGLSKLLLDYSNWDNRDFDAKVDGKAVEIKATGSVEGTTTINLKKIRKNKNNFAYLLWVYFDLDRDEILLKKITYENLEEKIKLIDNKKERESISLNLITSTLIAKYKFNLKMKTLEKLR